MTVEEGRGYELALIDKGKYRTRIQNIWPPRALKSHLGCFMLPIEVEINRQKCFVYVTGYLDMAMMIYVAREHWIGSEVSVKVYVREYKGKTFNTFSILWNDNNDGTR